MALDPVALDRHITGNYGEDFFDGTEELDTETCSWCTTEVPDSALREHEDGARLCPECYSEATEIEDTACHCGHPDCGAC